MILKKIMNILEVILYSIIEKGQEAINGSS